jgi:hypothetical protein
MTDRPPFEGHKGFHNVSITCEDFQRYGVSIWFWNRNCWVRQAHFDCPSLWHAQLERDFFERRFNPVYDTINKYYKYND